MLDICKIAPTVTVLIPARNGARTLNELLAMLSIQTVPLQEIIISDSRSVDETVSIAEKYGVQVVPVDPKTFDHGGTRTMLARKAKGDIVVFCTQDVIPKRKDAIEKLIAPFFQDEDVATTYGRQFPSFGADFFSASLRYFNYPENAQTRSLADRKRFGLKTAFTSNSFAAYRKKYLAEIGFFKDGLIFGEDTIAVANLLLNGKKIAYAADAEVYHSHNYSALEEFKRYFDIGVLHTQENWFIREFGTAEGQGKNYLRHVLTAIRKSGHYQLFPVFFYRSFMKYLGYLLGRRHRFLPRSVVPALSLHPYWWRKKFRNS